METTGYRLRSYLQAVCDTSIARSTGCVCFCVDIATIQTRTDLNGCVPLALATGPRSKRLNKWHGGPDVRRSRSSGGHSSKDQHNDVSGRKSSHVLSCSLYRLHVYRDMVHFETE